MLGLVDVELFLASKKFKLSWQILRVLLQGVVKMKKKKRKRKKKEERERLIGGPTSQDHREVWQSSA